ncbi:Molybdenum cofactor sulfurase [Phytophthora cinnamomi]|uniref:Molybdenum cofactor sulfurase n=1 Tax=Phytophthora cinnamomi TaxID=4785 RepID=UPI003559F09D|nr:Molybdenum cofactor sulfurase [Phytophthora cinnamomi]
MIALLTPATLARTNFALRCAQFVCCLLGMAFVAAGGITFHSSIFVLLMNYTGMLYTLWFVGAVGIFNFSNRLSTRVEQGIDAVLAFVLLIGGICLAASDYLKFCELVWHCHNLKASVAFTFIGMFCFIATLTLSILTTTKEPSGPTEVPGQYHLEMTPSGVLSPIEGVNSPGAKV